MMFQSTLPVWGATDNGSLSGISGEVSIHAPRVGSDLPIINNLVPGARFQSTLPVWGATQPRFDHPIENHVSIHAPRVRSDGSLR